MECRAAANYAKAMDEICRDPAKRRDMLWCLAQLKDDQEQVRHLEKMDPTVRERMRAAEAELWRDGYRLDTAEGRAAGYGKLCEQRSPQTLAERCDCEKCVGERAEPAGID